MTEQRTPPPGVPSAFDVRTVVFLLRGDHPPELTDEALNALQAEHLAYGASLARRGLTVANGPFRAQTDDRFRGMSVYTVGPSEAQELAGQDPSVRAGRLTIEVAQWCVAEGKVAFPLHDGPVGERRTFDEL